MAPLFDFMALTYRRYAANSLEPIRYLKFSASTASSLPWAFSACGSIRTGTAAFAEPCSRTSWA
jgi:hypothetical protein